MLSESQIGEIWDLFEGYIDKKQIDAVAERFIELLVDQGVNDRTLQNVIGVDAVLDQAIAYYLEEDKDDDNEELDF